MNRFFFDDYLIGFIVYDFSMLQNNSRKNENRRIKNNHEKFAIKINLDIE